MLGVDFASKSIDQMTISIACRRLRQKAKTRVACRDAGARLGELSLGVVNWFMGKSHRRRLFWRVVEKSAHVLSSFRFRSIRLAKKTASYLR